MAASTFVGFGFGAIQAGLFLYEAQRSGAFDRLVVAEVMAQVVDDIRSCGGVFSVNIARADGVEQCRVGPVEIYDPAAEADRESLVAAVAEAGEIATAVPSVDLYATDSAGSIHRILAEGLRRKAEAGGPRCVIYAAENNNAAAEQLEELVLAEVPPPSREGVGAVSRFLNTVIGKMSGLVDRPAEHDLATVTGDGSRAFLVEEFNRILVSAVDFPEPFERGIAAFDEKADLLPFEEAKLYGHNATHALAAYVGGVMGARTIAELRDLRGAMAFLRRAFLDESGEALIRKHGGIDSLFTAGGYAAYADDLLARMTSPHLMDTVERVGRDPNRKLGWDDRLVGTMRVALSQGIEPERYAFGTAAGLAALDATFLESDTPVAEVAAELWKEAAGSPAEFERIVALVEGGRRTLREWRDAGLPELDEFFESGHVRRRR